MVFDTLMLRHLPQVIRNAETPAVFQHDILWLNAETPAGRALTEHPFHYNLQQMSQHVRIAVTTGVCSLSFWTGWSVNALLTGSSSLRHLPRPVPHRCLNNDGKYEKRI